MIHMIQKKYIQSIMKIYGMKAYKPLTTPLDANSKLPKDMAWLISDDVNSATSNFY